MKYKLKDLLEEKGYIRGPFGSALKRGELKSEGIPVYEQQNAIYNNRDFRYFIDEVKYEELKRFTVQADDLVISCSGTVGKTTIIRQEDPIGIISQALLILRPNRSKVLPDYLYYFFTSSRGYNSIISRSSGSVQVNIAKRAIIESIEIEVPSIEEQEKIVRLLKSLDSKIELNTEVNKTLEEMAQAIFKQWFVNFEFPNEEGKPYKSSCGEMVESELGMIPKDWGVNTLPYFGDLIMGQSPSGSTYNFDGQGLGLINGASDFSNKLIRPQKYTTEPKKISQKGDWVFGVRATVGNVTLVDKEYAIGRGAGVFRVFENVSHEFIYFQLEKEIEYLAATSLGSVYINLSKSDFEGMKLVVPSNTLLQKFHLLANPIFNKMNFIIQENTVLINIRDIILPKLMSGEIRIPVE